MTENQLSIRGSANYYVICLLLAVAYLTKLIDVFFGFSPANIVVLIFLVANIHVGRGAVLIFGYVVLVVFSIVTSQMIGLVETGVNSEPHIEEYSGFRQLLVGLLYELRYILVLYAVVFSRRVWISSGKNEALLKFIFYVLTVNCIVAVYEFYVPSFHAWLSSVKGAYGEDFSFLYRGITLLFNVYDGAFAVPMLASVGAILFYEKSSALYLVFIFALIILQFMLGTRVGIFALLSYVGLFFALNSKNYKLLLRNVLLTLIISFVGLFALYWWNSSARLLIDSVLTLSDSAGSIDQHHRLFLSGIDLISRYPFGLGVGRVNFAALENNSFYNPESFAMALAIDVGVLACIIFYVFHIKIIRELFAGQRDVAKSAVVALIVSFCLVSVINIQIFYSVFIAVFFPVIVYCGANISKYRAAQR